MRRYFARLSHSVLAVIFGLVLNATIAAEPYVWGYGYGEINRDAALTSIKWEFLWGPGNSAAWTISNLPPFDPTRSGIRHGLRIVAHRGIDAVDFDGFGAALASPLFRRDLTLDGVFVRSDFADSQADAWNNIQIDTIEMQIQYNRSANDSWSFWPSLYLYGTAIPVPEPSTLSILALMAIMIIPIRCRKSKPTFSFSGRL